LLLIGARIPSEDSTFLGGHGFGNQNIDNFITTYDKYNDIWN